MNENEKVLADYDPKEFYTIHVIDTNPNSALK